MKNFKIENSKNVYNFGTQEKHDIRSGDYDYVNLQVDNYFTCDDIELGALSYQNGDCEISYDTPENNLWSVYADASSDLMKLLHQINEERNCIKSITLEQLQDIFDKIKNESQKLSNHIENLENLRIFLKNLTIAINDNYPDFNEIDIDSAEIIN
jgi:hypothetical protein